MGALGQATLIHVVLYSSAVFAPSFQIVFTGFSPASFVKCLTCFTFDLQYAGNLFKNALIFNHPLKTAILMRVTCERLSVKHPDP